MGSYLSCASYSSVVPYNTVKVLAFNGGLQEFHTEMKVAEIMLENPQHFVCHSDSLEVGRRINALSADNDLELGHLYLVLPMSKLQRVLSGSEMASIAFRANSAMKKSSKSVVKTLPGLVGVKPLVNGGGMCLQDNDHLGGEFHYGPNDLIKTEEVPKLNMEDLSDLQMGLVKYIRLRSCRSWKPRLETIREAESLGV
ncbi:hypothetical protein SUGI_0977120 [Cryptomeria japonica]|uniref:uncharacterized protein LOC131067403 n=1 Tax=Cryptomeria japonica TaxID=3369 RepID=UPI002414C594|nr:uncharacterized protein LOC131067403 [Cryptomeria japonica]GLJ46354.1 hypothetical protein SUGI_0977120 [Cryptomeria japonica]